MLLLAQAAKLSLREVEGYGWDVPDHSTLCRRMRRLQLKLPAAKPGARLCFVLDSTGLKVSGAGEWRARHARSGKEESKTGAPAAPAAPARR